MGECKSSKCEYKTTNNNMMKEICSQYSQINMGDVLNHIYGYSIHDYLWQCDIIIG